MDSRTFLTRAALGAVTLASASAAYADLIYPADKYTIISSGISSGGSFDPNTGIRTGGTFTPGDQNFNTPPPGFWETTVQYGKYSGGLFTASPLASIGGFSTGNPIPVTALNVKPVDYPGATYDYAAPLNVYSPVDSSQVGGTSWISPFIQTTNNTYGPHTDEPAKLPLGMGGNSSVFAYTTVFDANPINKNPNGPLRDFAISGQMMSDDDVLDVWVDYGTAGATQLAYTQTIENPLYVGAHTGPFQLVGTFSGDFQSTDLTHSLTFFVSNRHFDRSALDYTATLIDPIVEAVPEPGTIAFGVIMAGGLFGLIQRARRNRKSV